MTKVRVALPVHLRTLARIEGELPVEVPDRPTIQEVLDAVEARYPVLRGTIRDHATAKRRAFIRYFAAGRDVSHEPPDTPLPEPVASGSDVFQVLGAISGG
jgi:sulfur-carrier protein